MKLARFGLLFALAGATQAHHAAAMYDTDSPQKLAGTVKSFSWGNPHSWITLTVSDANGGSTDWLIECNSPALLKRFGWTPNSVQPGDMIKVTMAPHVDGIKRGEAIHVTTSKGVTLDNAMEEP